MATNIPDFKLHSYQENQSVPVMAESTIIEAWYGAMEETRSAKGKDVTEQVRKVLRDGGQLKAHNSLFGDPAPA